MVGKVAWDQGAKWAQPVAMIYPGSVCRTQIRVGSDRSGSRLPNGSRVNIKVVGAQKAGTHVSVPSI